MKKLAYGTVFDTDPSDLGPGRDPNPFFGFLTGTAFSMALWIGLLVGLWIVIR